MAKLRTTFVQEDHIAYVPGGDTIGAQIEHQLREFAISDMQVKSIRLDISREDWAILTGPLTGKPERGAK